MPRRVFQNLAAYLRDGGRGSGARLSEDLGISTAYVSMIKDRQRQPPLNLALRIAEHCNIPLESLLRLPSRKAS